MVQIRLLFHLLEELSLSKSDILWSTIEHILVLLIFPDDVNLRNTERHKIANLIRNFVIATLLGQESKIKLLVGAQSRMVKAHNP